MLPGSYFTRSEFECPCCCRDTIDAELLYALQVLRYMTDRPITITSGFRCGDHNHKVGGSILSMHLQGKAADIQVKNHEPAEVFRMLDSMYPHTCGIGLYENHVHFDIRKTKERW